jgi:hypothetical protein
MTMAGLLQRACRAAWLAAAVGFHLSAGSAVAADAVLLASTVPGYAPGMVVAPTDRLNLPEGASATLLFQTGEMLRLRGPFDGVLEPPREERGSGTIAMLADLLRVHGVDAAVIGGTRAMGGTRVVSALDDVQIDPQRSGTYCLQPSSSVWIARPGSEPGSYAVRRKSSLRSIAWPSGAPRVEWPVNVPIEDGDRFEIVIDGTSRATATFRVMTAVGTPNAGWIAEGILRGCREQFEEPLRRLARGTIGPELWLTSDRGRHPVYRAGEPIALTVAADADGFLFCVAVKDDGVTTPVFPAGAVDGAALRGSAPMAIPGRRQPAPLTLTAIAGTQQVRCWLTDRDVSPELPHALLAGPADRLPDPLAADLDGVFSRVGGTRIATSVLTIRTE